MFFRPLHGVSQADTFPDGKILFRSAGKLAQRIAFGFAHLCRPQQLQFFPAQILLLPTPFIPRQPFAQVLDVGTGHFWFLREQFCYRPVNLPVAFGKTVAEFLGDTFDLKITSDPVANRITERTQFAGEFMVISVLGEFSGAKQLVILERLPAIFGSIKGCIEDNAMGMQVRIKGARRVVREQRRRHIASLPVKISATHPDTRGGKRFKFTQGRPDSAIMRLNDATVFTGQRNQRNGFWREKVKS
jgi:hypothetical protein